MVFSRLLTNRINTLSRQARSRFIGFQGTKPRLMSTQAIDAGFQAKYTVVALLFGLPLAYWGYHQASLAINRMESFGASTVKDEDVLKYRALMASLKEDDEDDEDDDE